MFFTRELADGVSITGNETVLQRLSTAAIVLILTSLPTNPLAFFFFFLYSGVIIVSNRKLTGLL